MVAIKIRKLTEAEKSKGFKEVVHIRPGDPHAGDIVEVFDPQTGRTTGRTFSKRELGQYRPGGRRGTGFLFVTGEPTPKVAGIIRGKEEHQEEKELAQKEAEFEAGRIARGLPVVPLERKGAAKLLKGKLEERGLIKEPKVKPMEERIIEPKKLGEQLVEPEVKPKRAVELFSPLARERFGITETPEGLLEIRKGERKVVLEPRRVELRKTFMELVEEPFKKKEAIRREVRAELPVTAEFRTGFESQLGKEEQRLIGIKTPSGVLTFKTIQKPITKRLREVFKPSTEFFEERELELKRELRGRPSVVEDRQFKKLGISELRTIQLRAGQLAVGGEIGVRRQIAEKPLETGAIIATGAVFGAVAAKPAIAKAAAFRVSSTALGTAFVGVTGVEVGLQVRKGKFVEAGAIIGERTTEALLFVGAGKLAIRGAKGLGKFRFERKVRVFEEKLPKFTEQELKLRLGTGGIETRQVRKFPREIQTTFDIKPRVKTAEEAVRIRIFEKAKAPLKKPQVPERVAIIKTETADILEIPPKIITLEQTGKFDVSTFGKAPKQFKDIRVRLGRLGDIEIKNLGIQKVLAEPKPKVGGFRTLKGPPKFEPPVRELPKPFKGKPAKGLDLEAISKRQERFKLIKSIEEFAGKPGKGTPQEFARQKGFVFVEPLAERPRIDITKFGGKEIIPSGISIPKGTIKPITKVTSPALLGLVGTIRGMGVREAQDIISGQKLKTRLEVSQKPQQDLISDLERITGTEPKPAFDIASGLASIQELEQVQGQEQIVITIPKPPKPPKRGRPGVPPSEVPIRPPPPPPPPPLLFPFIPKLFLGEGIKRKKRPLRQEFAFTPDFIASVLNQFGAAPTQRKFTGQERRLKIKGARFVTPLPKKGSEGLIQLVARQLGG